jgi:hypothetical protein
MYERRIALAFCMHIQSCSNNVVYLGVPQKLVMKTCLNSSHEPVDPGARLLIQARAASLRCNCNSCKAFSPEPPLTVTAVTMSSSQILGSCCPLT